MGGSTYSGAGAIGAVSGGIAGSLSGRTSSSGSYGATVSGTPGHGPDSVGGVPPIIIDLDGDGVELVSLAEPTAFFDIDKDGFRENMGWAGADDGFLVMDLNGDGDVQAGEIAFAGQTRADDTDMEAFRALYDSNDDGKFTSADAKWSKARVWQDQDQDGAVDAGEMRTLGQASLTSIGLVSNGREQTVAGNTIAGLSKATFADGRTSDVADAMLDATDIGLQQTRGGYRIEIDGGNDVFVAGGSAVRRSFQGAETISVLSLRKFHRLYRSTASPILVRPGDTGIAGHNLRDGAALR